MTKKLGVCIVGSGVMGHRHAAAWANLAEAEIVAVADINPESTRRLAEQYGLKSWSTDYREAIRLAGVDVVSVCTPTALHPEITLFAAACGKHIFCEKPIALTLPEAEAMIEAARQHGVYLGIGLMRRFSPVLPALRDWLAQGRLGRPVLYHGLGSVEIRPKRAMHDARANGGPVIDMGVHYFDSWAYLFDAPPLEVFAQGLMIARDRPELAHIQAKAVDTAAIVVKYASGDIGSYTVCWGLPPGVNGLRAPDQLFAPGGLVQIETNWGEQEARLMRQGGAWELLARTSVDMYHAEIACFAESILQQKPFPVPGEVGRAALEVALAALRSIETGQPVYLG